MLATTVLVCGSEGGGFICVGERGACYAPKLSLAANGPRFSPSEARRIRKPGAFERKDECDMRRAPMGAVSAGGRGLEARAGKLRSPALFSLSPLAFDPYQTTPARQ